MKILYKLADAITGNARQSSDQILSIAQRAIKKPETITPAEIKSLAGSVISQARK